MIDLYALIPIVQLRNDAPDCFRQVSCKCWRADLVKHNVQRLAGLTQFLHGEHEIGSEVGIQPRCADNQTFLHVFCKLFALQFGMTVKRDRFYKILLGIGFATLSIKHVIG